MSVQVVNTKRKIPDSDDSVCLFCDSLGRLVKQPKLETFHTIKLAAERRKDEVSKKFNKLYCPDCSLQCFSWHRNCMAS